MAVFPSDSVRTKDWRTEILTDADLEAQLDLLHAYLQACLNATSGHSHTGASNQGPKISPANLLIASQATGDLLYASSATAWARLAKGTASQFLKMKSDATIPEWGTNLWSDMPAGSVVQVVESETASVVSIGNNTIPLDTSVPLVSEGTLVLTRTITPKSATNILKITFHASYGVDIATAVAAAFNGDTCVAVTRTHRSAANAGSGEINLVHYMAAGATTELTFTVRVGNGVSGDYPIINGMATTIGAGAIFGGATEKAYLIIEEFKV